MEGKGELGAGGESQKLREICHVSSRKGGKIDKRRKEKSKTVREREERKRGGKGRGGGREGRKSDKQRDKQGGEMSLASIFP